MRRWVLLLLLLPWSVVAQGPVRSPANPAQDANKVTLTRQVPLSSGVERVLLRLPAGVRASVLVQEVGGGPVREEVLPDEPFIPASTIKLLTGAAVLFDLGGADGWWSTELTVPAAQVGQARVKAVTLRGSGDPTLSVSDPTDPAPNPAGTGGYSLRALAKQAYAAGLRVVGQVRIDDARLDGTGWQTLPIGDYLGVPYLGTPRLREWYASPPNSAAEARERLGAALIAELRRAGVQVTSSTVGQAAPDRPYVPPQRSDDQGRPLPPDPFIPVERRPEQGIASVRSAPPIAVLQQMGWPSDNLLAEELLSTLGVKPRGDGTLAGALARERAFLRQIGVDVTPLNLADGSGLSRENRLSARALVRLLVVMYDLPYPMPGQSALPDALYRQHQNAFAEMLPQAGTGVDNPRHDTRGGTMALRLVGSGLDVRAKTGTLPGVSALAGYVTGKSGRVLAFALLMNGPETAPILTLRALQDDLVREIAAAH